MAKRCEKFNFKTGEEVVKAFKDEGIRCEISSESTICKSKIHKCDISSDICEQCTIDYLNQEVETNFEHYKKEYADIIQDTTYENWGEKIPMTISLYDYLLRFFKKSTENFNGTLQSSWLKQEYRP